MANWAYIAHRDGYLGGVCSADIPASHLGRFLKDFANFDIKVVNSREEYLSFIDGMPFWSERSEKSGKAQ
jgi:hypothetical protein